MCWLVRPVFGRERPPRRHNETSASRDNHGLHGRGATFARRGYPAPAGSPAYRRSRRHESRRQGMQELRHTRIPEERPEPTRAQDRGQIRNPRTPENRYSGTRGSSTSRMPAFGNAGEPGCRSNPSVARDGGARAPRGIAGRPDSATCFRLEWLGYTSLGHHSRAPLQEGSKVVAVVKRSGA